MAKREFAMLTQGTAGRQEVSEVRVMARAEGYAMVRYRGCRPFVVSDKDLTPRETNAKEAEHG